MTVPLRVLPEVYFAERSGTGFSHGICPECFDRVVKAEIEGRGPGA